MHPCQPEPVFSGMAQLGCVTFVMTGVQYSCVQTEEGHWLALVQRPSHQPHSVTRDDSKQEVQVVS